MVDRLLQGHHGEFGRHRGHPEAPQLRADVPVGHPAVGPGTPRDRRRGHPLRPPSGDEGVQGRVRRGVRRLPGAAPHPRDRGEQDKRVHRVAEQLVEVDRPGDLPGDDVLDIVARPDAITPDPDAGRWRYWRAAIGPTRWIRVVVAWHEEAGFLNGGPKGEELTLKEGDNARDFTISYKQ